MRESTDETDETPPRLNSVAKKLIYVLAAANIAVAVVGLLAPGEFLLSSGTPATYLIGELHMEGIFTVTTAQIALYSATVHATRTDRIGAVTLCVCAPLLFPPFTPTVLTVPLVNFRAITALPDALSLPHGGLLLIGAILWNFDVLREHGPEEPHPSGVDDDWSVSAYLQRHRWRIVSRAAAYTLVVACVVVPVVQRPPQYLWRIVLPFLAVATYTFVSTDSVRGTGGLAVGALVTGLASLQYDTALPGVAFPTAALLTVSAVALWLSEQTHETRGNTHGSTPRSGV